MTSHRIKWVVLFTLFTLQVMPLSAQWSVLKGDPRPKKPAHLYQEFDQKDWDASNYASQKDLKWFQDAKYGMFVHFGLSTYKNAELSWGICKVRKAPDSGEGPYPTDVWTKWADEFKLPEFDAKKLVQHARDAGMQYIVVIAKHHDGFHMWNTEFSDFKITNTPFGRDFVKEVADECHQTGMKFGIYYSQRDWYHPDYCPVDPRKVTQKGTRWKLKPGETNPMGARHKKYLEYQNNVCRELCTKYGKIDVFWFDALYWGGMFNAEMWDAENLTRMIRKLQPGIIINNRASLPGDFDTPEQRIGMFQNHRPWESCMCLCKSWSYSETPTKSPTQIITMFTNTLCGDGNMLMSWGPQWSGKFHPNQVNALKEAGTWIKKNREAIYGTRGGPWKPANWGGSVYRGKIVYLHILSLEGLEKLVLSGLEQKVVSAARLDGTPVQFTQNGGKLELMLPAKIQDKVNTIVKLTLDSPVRSVIDTKPVKSMFDDPEYGSEISQKSSLKTSSSGQGDKESNHAKLFTGELMGDAFAFCTQSEKNPWVQIDLGGEHHVKGILIRHRSEYDSRRGGMKVSVSTDGEKWEPVWAEKDQSDTLEIPVTSYIAGAYIPGKKARYVRVERVLKKPDALHLRELKVYGK